MKKFNVSKQFESEEKMALIAYHQNRLTILESLANRLESVGVKGRVYVTSRVFASRHARRINDLRNS